ncbi:lipoprotein [Micromonospora sp. RTGN7]|uniref:lipoprotein n=1 Tax=Micromonospora sp. RTGN7 TaxID=3016526 RepID=UPI0029FED279|nr:lipoprotein [Micromonospora sp. RTGN7]
MFRRTGAALVAALVLLTAAGCAEEMTARTATPGASPVVSGPPWYDEVAPAPAGVTVGAGGSACELPITFSVPARWAAAPVGDASGMTLGGSRLRCEVDAKPAGKVGFLRVWAVEAGTLDVRASLEEFLAEYGRVSEIEYRRVRRGPLELVEATYLQRNELSGGPNRQRALVAQTPGGAILLTFGGMDTGEFEAMFPAYQLATSTVRATR